jgi:CDP-ribitol ribitolphosphotransferase
MLFYAFDQKYYEATRDFYEPYDDLVPGKIVHDFDELMLALKNRDYEFEKMDGFIHKNFTYTDGKSTDRVIDQIILGNAPTPTDD